MLIEVQIECLLIDTVTEQPVIMLQESDGDRTVPIVIGLSEAGAIASELEQIEFPRPMTHDLLKDTIDQLGGHVEAVIINALKSNTFYARLVLRQGDRRLELDSRPSDAIAVAVRCNAPIYAEESVVEQVAINREVARDTAIPEELVEEEPPATPTAMPAGSDPEKLKEMLEKLTPEDFGKYKM